MPLPSLTRAARLAPVVLCAALAGCEVEVSGLSAVGDLAFEVREVHPPFNYAAGRDPQLAVLLGPDAGVPCGLRTELGIGEGVITVHVLGIDRTIVCAGDVATSAAEIFLPPLSGTAELRITNDGRSDRYTLNVNSSQIAVSPVRSTFSHPRVVRVWRYPTRSAAFHCGPAAAAAACQTLRDEVVAAGSFTPLSFGPEAALPVTYEPFSTQFITTYHRYESEGAFDQAGARLRDRLPALRAEYPQVWVILTNWRAVYYP